MRVEDELRRAIEGRRGVLLRYEGDGEPMRTFHPHGLLVSAHGDLLVEGYQVAGYTNSGPLPQWRLFTVERIAEIEVLEQRFPIAPGWNPEAQRYERCVVVAPQ